VPEKGLSANPSFDLVQKLAQFYGVSTEELTGAAEAPSAAALQVERIHRGLDQLSDRDREIIEAMIASMQQKPVSKE